VAASGEGGRGEERAARLIERVAQALQGVSMEVR
jgi:hypothetical protein